MSVRATSVWHRLAHWLRAEGRHIVAILIVSVGLAITVVSFVPGLEVAFGIVGLFTALGSVLFVGYQSIRRQRAVRLGSASPVDANRRLVLTEEPVVVGLPDTQYLIHGTAARDDSIDVRLGSMAERFDLRSDEYVLPRSLVQKAPYLLKRVAGSRYPWNDLAVRLEADLSSQTPTEPAFVPLRPVRYFDVLTSNHLSSFEVLINGARWDFRREFVYDGAGRFHSLSTSQLANAIGVSTVAVTTDGAVVVALQSINNGSSQNLWAPSGSGSLEPSDLTENAQLSSLRDSLLYRAEKELSEESGIPADRIVKSQLIGYARWLEKSGSPEFLAVTALNISFDDFGPQPRLHSFLSRERLHTSEIRVVRPPVDGHYVDIVNDPLLRRGDRKPALRNGEDPRDISAPLEMALAALDRALGRDPSLLDNLRGNHAQGRPLPTGPVPRPLSRRGLRKARLT